MRLDEYQWSHNPRGLHNKGAPHRWNIDRLRQIKLGWAKMVAIDGEYMDDIGPLLANNITPIVRIFRPRFGAGPASAIGIEMWRGYVKRGVRWFEFYNEPNLENEWPSATPPTYTNINGIIAPLMTNWLEWAELMISMGAYPAFPALSETVGSTEDVSSWLIAMMTYLADHYFERFRAIIGNGLWCATHPYFYNHFYQEGPNVLTPRRSSEENALEGGWHFEYPYDPLTQASNPGLTATTGGPDFPQGDPIGLTGMGQAFMDYVQDIFGVGAIPVVGTEGGITPVPVSLGDTRQLDNRYPSFDGYSHAEATVAAFNWIATQAPPWMFGLTLWKEDDYFDGPGGIVRTVQRLSETQPIFKTVPPLDALDGPGSHSLHGGKGPGPIHGSPDYHFLMLSPGLNADWFFANGRAYWEQFRPTLITSPEYIAFLPRNKSLGITILSTPDMAGYMSQGIRDRWPNVWFDLIVAESESKVATVLQDRATSGKRFG